MKAESTAWDDTSLKTIGIIAGNGTLPVRFAREAKKNGCKVYAVCHYKETDPALEEFVDDLQWVKIGELNKLINFLKSKKVSQAVMLGGVNRIRLFGIKPDLRGLSLIYRTRSAKDDVLMRAIADELNGEGIEIISSVIFLQESLVEERLLTKSKVSESEMDDIEVGANALKAIGSQDIGQLVVVKDGVIVAVEAIEGTDRAILRGGELGGPGTVVVKFAKPTQDMRFDVPTIGVTTIENMIKVKARVLALEAGRCILLDEDQVVKLANKHKIAIIGCPPLA
ncbi:hypothetical protein BVY02_02405 [bacterium J17]|nr:hypothetical protein BVY02_02405 [bacterium J17]